MGQTTLFIILGIVIFIGGILIFFVALYNKFQTAMVAINEAEASVDSELRKRFDLLNKAVKIVKSYVGHEKDVLENIVKLRSRRLSNFDLDKELNKSIMEFNALAEDYADLKSSDNFLKLQSSVIDVEQQLAACRKFYNNKVSEYNKLVRIFPSNIISKIFKFEEKPYFEYEKEKDAMKELK